MSFAANSAGALAAAAKAAAKKYNTKLGQSPLYGASQQQSSGGSSNNREAPPGYLTDTAMGPGRGVITQPAMGPGQGVVTQPGFSNSAGGSYASGPGLDRPGTGSTLVDQGLGSLTELGNKYADNEMIGGLVTGTYADIARTQANTGLAIQYNDAMYESMGRFQGNLENLRTANTSKLMAQEAALTGGLMDKQGNIQRKGLRVAGDEQRKGIRETGTQSRLNIAATGAQNRLTIGEQGSQERMNIRERTQAQKNLRADARGAIRRSGARFFG